MSSPRFLNWKVAEVLETTVTSFTFSSFCDSGSKCSLATPLIRLRLKESQAFNSYTRLLKSLKVVLLRPVPTDTSGNVAPKRIII